jgi:hypothetical protein
MATPADWTELAERFRALPTPHDLHSIRLGGSWRAKRLGELVIEAVQSDGDVEQSAEEAARLGTLAFRVASAVLTKTPPTVPNVGGGPQNPQQRAALHARYCALAAEAAVLAGVATKHDTDAAAVSAWLDLLDWGPFHRGDYGEGNGFIGNLAEASAVLCEELRSKRRRQEEDPPSGKPSDLVPLSGARTYSNRASWLATELRARNLTIAELSARGGAPDRKTLQKILQGAYVRGAILDKLADALSFKGKSVARVEIPDD